MGLKSTIAGFFLRDDEGNETPVNLSLTDADPAIAPPAGPVLAAGPDPAALDAARKEAADAKAESDRLKAELAARDERDRQAVAKAKDDAAQSFADSLVASDKKLPYQRDKIAAVHRALADCDGSDGLIAAFRESLDVAPQHGLRKASVPATADGEPGAIVTLPRSAGGDGKPTKTRLAALLSKGDLGRAAIKNGALKDRAD